MTDEQQEQVRRLLAEARHDEPIPAEVAERLDLVIAGLADEPRRSAAVVRLAERRRRAAGLLVAAAAVVAVGVGGAQMVRGLSGTTDSQSTAGSAAEGPGTFSGAEEGVGAPGNADDSEDPADSAGGAGTEDGEATRPWELRSQRFSQDAAALQSLELASDPSAEADPGPGRGDAAYDARLSRAAKQTVCTPGDWGRGGFFAVVYDGTPGWMVLRPPAGDTQVADLFLCGGEQAVRSVTLPVR